MKGGVMLKPNQINIRDPFVLTDPANRCYYMYGTTGQSTWDGEANGFDAYRSSDLENWEGPLPAFRPPNGFWSDINHWAPEVHAYRGRYYAFITFYCSDKHRRRGTQILVADSPAGPFVPWSDGPVTPAEWECLDGTLLVDAKSRPWIVFCHEWVQITDGTICALPLQEDLSAPAGEAVTLFAGSVAGWARPLDHSIRKGNYVTDGPFPHRLPGGALLMLWSSAGEAGYTMGMAVSRSGNVLGPWQQIAKPIFAKDGGHGMVFRRLDGQLMITVHHPNQTPSERPVFLPVRETEDGLELA